MIYADFGMKNRKKKTYIFGVRVKTELENEVTNTYPDAN
jgi:hypothetical protein